MNIQIDMEFLHKLIGSLILFFFILTFPFLLIDFLTKVFSVKNFVSKEKSPNKGMDSEQEQKDKTKS